MIFTVIIKHWRLIIDALLVIGVIVFIFLWNPMNLFGQGLNLQNTANLVAEIREIGELTTAEYYGEVIASHDEAKLKIMDESSVHQEAEFQYLVFKKILFDTYDRRKTAAENEPKAGNRRKLLDQLKKTTLNESVEAVLLNIQSGNPLMKPLVLFVGQHEHNQNTDFKKIEDNDDYIRKKISNVLEEEYDRIAKRVDSPELQEYLNEGFRTVHTFTSFYYDYSDQGESRSGRKKQLAIIGRGCVKAGFRFDRLDEQNFVYDESNQVIHFYGFRAEILDQDINPWFIPEQGVPGFQIITEENADFEDMKALKIHCINKLVNYAREAGVVEQAQANGEEALKEFFSLVLGEEIREVVFHQDELVYHSKTIVGDSVITYGELAVIDSLYRRNLQAIDAEQNPAIRERRKALLKTFLSTLRSSGKIRFETKSGSYSYPFNYFNRHLPGILRDSLISDPEVSQVEKLRHHFVDEKKDTLRYAPPSADYWYWFDDSLAYLGAYNLFIDTLLQSGALYGFYNVRDTTVELTSAQIREGIMPEDVKRLTKTALNLPYELSADSLHLFYLVEGNALKPSIKYPVRAHFNYDSLIMTDPEISWHKRPLKSPDHTYRYTSFVGEDTLIASTALDNLLFEAMDSIRIDKFPQGIPIEEIKKGLNDQLGFSIFSGYNYVTFEVLQGIVDSVRLQKAGDTLEIIHRMDTARGRLSASGIVWNGNPNWLRVTRIRRDVLDSIMATGGLSVIAPIFMRKELSQREKEILVLKRYIMERNQKYNNIGPAVRARRWLEQKLRNKEIISEQVSSVRAQLAEWSRF